MKNSKIKVRKNRVKKREDPHVINSECSFTIDHLMKKRVGGSQNIKGMGFQLIYACYLILSKLSDKEKMQLDGLEDIDFINVISDNEYIQLKSSKNILNAGDFWELNVLQNFLEVYKINPQSKFRLVHNTTFSKGKLEEVSKKTVSLETLKFWEKKFINSGIDISNVIIKNFLNSIEFECVQELQLINQCLKLLLDKFKVNIGTEKQYFNALFNCVFNWSKNRSTIQIGDIHELIQLVTDSFSKFPQDLALQNNWITMVDFEAKTSGDLSDYYDGKAAKPIHVANN